MGIFDSSVNVFTTYHARLQLRDKLMGGIPLDPKVIESWLRVKTGLTTGSEEYRLLLRQTMEEVGSDVFDGSDDVAATKHGVGFKRDPTQGLYLESRCVKAMLKETANIYLAGVKAVKMGAYGKGPKGYFAENVHIDPDKMWLGVSEPTDMHLFIGHTTGPSGLQSSLTYYEYVERPVLEFDVRVIGDGVADGDWMAVWVCAQEVGVGALRSQGFGTFDIEQWEMVGEAGERTVKRGEQAVKPPKAAKPPKNGKVEPPVTLVLA